MFDLQHLEGVSADLVQSMFQVSRKAAELERRKLVVDSDPKETDNIFKLETGRLCYES